MLKVLLVGIYDTNTVSLAPQILRSYAEKHSKVAAQCDIVTREFSIFRDSTRHITDEINKEKADIIGFSVYIWNMQEVLEIAKNVTGKVVIGGPQVTGIEKDILRGNPEIEIIVTGEGEGVFADLLEYYAGKKKIANIRGITTREIQTPQGPDIKLDSIPSVYGRIFREHPEISWISLETSRGCPMGCRFCSWSYGRRMRYASVEKVKRDLDIILKQPNVKNIYLCDSSLLLNKERAKDILKHIIEAGADKSIRYEFSAEQLDNELIDLLAKLPSHEFNFGIQSINKKALSDMGRAFRRDLFEKNYLTIAEKFKDANNITIDLIYGLPGDDIGGYKSSLNYAISLPGIRRILTNPLIVLPGSAFFRDRRKYKLVLRDEKSYIVKSTYTFSSSDMSLARKYSFFVAVIYFNYRLRDLIKRFAEKEKRAYIEMIIDFMESLPFAIIKDEDYPDMVPSIKKDFDHRNAAFVNVIERYDEIVDHFKAFSSHRYDKNLADYTGHYSEHFYRLKSLLSADAQ